jgi:hypothetical protein
MLQLDHAIRRTSSPAFSSTRDVNNTSIDSLHRPHPRTIAPPSSLERKKREKGCLASYIADNLVLPDRESPKRIYHRQNLLRTFR